MPNISSYNINDVALYYHALGCLSSDPLESADATERVRQRLVNYLERRRAALSLPPLRTEMSSLGIKALAELRQMGLVSVDARQASLLPAGADVVAMLSSGRAREARRQVLSRLIETFDNVYGFVKALSPPAGKDLFLPVPRGAALAEVDPDLVRSEAVETLDLAGVCDAWRAWCKERGRDDLCPANLPERAKASYESSTDRDEANRIKNAVQQVVLEAGTRGAVERMTIFRTIRDRLSTAGAVGTRLLVEEGAPIGVEVAYTCLRIGGPSSDATDGWLALDVPREPFPIKIHEPSVEDLAERVIAEMRTAAAQVPSRAGYFRIYELRDRVCHALTISNGLFDATFVHIYQKHPEILSLGVDYETITAKRLPVEFRSEGRTEQFNLVAFRDPVH